LAGRVCDRAIIGAMNRAETVRRPAGIASCGVDLNDHLSLLCSKQLGTWRAAAAAGVLLL